MRPQIEHKQIDFARARTADSGLPYLALVAVQVFFGSFPVIGKVVLAVIPSLALVGFRIVLTAGVLYLAQRSRGTLRLADSRDYARLAVLGVFGVALNQTLFVTGLSLTKAANVSLLAVTIPIFTILISVAAGNERLRWKSVAGILLAALGVLFLIDPRRASFSSSTTIGDLLIVCNSLSYGIFVATSKETLIRNGALRSMTWIFIFSSLMCLPFALWSFAPVDAASVRLSIWLLVGYIALFATAVPYLLNAWALARVKPSTVAVFIYLQPLIGFVSAVVFLGEHIDLKFGIAALLIFAGLYLTTRRETNPVKLRNEIEGSI